MQLSHFSGCQVCYSRNAPRSKPERLLSDRERGERSPLWHLAEAVCSRMKVLTYPAPRQEVKRCQGGESE